MLIPATEVVTDTKAVTALAASKANTANESPTLLSLIRT